MISVFFSQTAPIQCICKRLCVEMSSEMYSACQSCKSKERSVGGWKVPANYDLFARLRSTKGLNGGDLGQWLNGSPVVVVEATELC